MIYQANTAAYVGFTTNDSTGAATDADSTPTATLYVNGASNGATVTVTNVSTGAYLCSFTVPSGLSVGDDIQLLISATIDGTACKSWTGRGYVDVTVNSRSSHSAADVATAVWAAGTRTLTSFGTLVADAATAVWGAVTRTLTTYSAAPGVALVRGLIDLTVDGDGRTTRKSERLYVGETPLLRLRVRTVNGEPVPLVGPVVGKITNMATGAVIAEDIETTAVSLTDGILSLEVPEEATDEALAGKKLNLTLSWEDGDNRLQIAGGVTLEITAP